MALLDTSTAALEKLMWRLALFKRYLGQTLSVLKGCGLLSIQFTNGPSQV